MHVLVGLAGYPAFGLRFDPVLCQPALRACLHKTGSNLDKADKHIYKPLHELYIVRLLVLLIPFKE